MRLTDTVQRENAFNYEGGKAAKKISELIDAIESGSVEDFHHHVNHGRNDFSDWIKDIFHQEGLALEIRKITDKGQLAEKLREELEKQQVKDALELQEKQKYNTIFIEPEKLIKEPIKIEEPREELFVTEKQSPPEIIIKKPATTYILFGILIGVIIGMLLARLFLS